MERPDLVGLQREPMPAEDRVRLDNSLTNAVSELGQLRDLVVQLDGRPLPETRLEFYAISGQIRKAERACAEYLKHASFWLAWDLDISDKPELSPRFPGMVPKR